MAETINARLLLRRDTAANWTSVNPILAQGEQGYETDTKKMKIGDGNTRWNDLDYWKCGEGGISTVAWEDITNKPYFARVAESGSYNDLADTPIIGNAKIGIFQGGVLKGTFTVNQKEDLKIELDAGQGGGGGWTLGNGLVTDPTGRLTLNLNPKQFKFDNVGMLNLVNEYATVGYVDEQVGNINKVLEEIIG